MRRVFLLVFPALLLLLACGEDPAPKRQPPPPASIGDAETYFNLAPCTCLEYTADTAAGGETLGVAVESVTDIFTVGEPHHLVRYRLGGAKRRVDFVRFDGNDLLLSRVNRGEQDVDHFYRLEPAVPFVRGPIEEQGLVEAATESALLEFADVQEGPTPITFRATYNAQEIEASVDGEAMTTMEASRMLFQGTPWEEEPRWFVPEVGFAKIELTLNDVRRVWTLANVRTLGGGCPWEPSEPPGDICGLPPTP